MSQEGTVLLRRGALGDVVLLGAITSRVPPPVTVVTAAAWMPVARRLRGVDRVLRWPAHGLSGRIIDLQASLATRFRFPLAARLHKHTLRRRLRLWGLGWGRPSVPDLYARAASVQPAPPPWVPLARGPADALVLVPAASTELKRPPLELLVQVARRWEGPVVGLGGPADQGVVDELVQRVPGAVGVAERGFARTFQHLGGAAVAVGGDTGLMHLAVACGVPAVVLAGPTHPDDGFLRSPGRWVMQRELPCRPCTLHRGTRCRLVEQRCFDLSGDQIWAAVEQASRAVRDPHR